MINPMMKPADISSLVAGRKLYIWGSGHFGASIRYAMVRNNIDVAGFIDTNMAGKEFLGFKVVRPDDILALGKENVFIIISAFLFTEEISRICESKGLRHTDDYLTHADIKPYHFEVDVAGRCNLRCITCPRGNFAGGPKTGMMSLDNYEKILDKLLREVPLLSDIQLYSWGEPLLNKDLPRMISHTVKKGLATAVSSNLSLKCDLESIIETGPTWFRVSVSGSDEDTYSVIHRPGKISLVIENLKRLSELRAKLAPKMFVEVNYHLYKHNLGGIPKMAQLCKELGFVFRTNYAFTDPLDAIIDYAQDIPLPPKMEEGRQYLLLDIDEAIKLSRQSGLHDCVSQNSFIIHSDLSFRRCTHLYNNESNILTENFLETPLEEILRRADNCEVCRICRSLGVHRYHFAYIDKGIELGSEA